MSNRTVILVDLETLNAYKLTTSNEELVRIKDSEDYLVIDPNDNSQLTLREGWIPIGEATVQSNGEIVTKEL